MNKVLARIKTGNIKWYGFILMLVCVAYFPIASFQYAIKNDFFQAYFPVKFFLSNSIKAGEWPIWNPFLNYGFPIFGDMSVSYWNPLTWIFAGIGYNAYLFTFEQLIYMVLAGIGMFNLMGRWTTNNHIKFLAAASYLCSGFMSSHQQHFNWITAVGLLPFCIHYFLAFIEGTDTIKALKLILSFTIFFTAVHPGMIVGIILMIISCTFIFKHSISSKNFEAKHIYITLAFFILLLAGMTYGYAEVIFETNRSRPVSAETGINGSTSVLNWITFILPLIANDKSGIFKNELTLRNCYLGLFMIALIIYTLFSKSQNKKISSFYFTGFLFMILSSDLVHSFYEKIPLINFVRLNGEFRLFGLFSFIIAGSMQLNEIYNCVNRKFLTVLKSLLIVIVAITIITLIKMRFETFQIHFSTFHFNSKDHIKQFLDQFNWKQALLIEGIIQSSLLIGLIIFYKKKYINLFTTFIILDLIINTCIQLPFTAIGRNKLEDIQKLIENAPQIPQQPYHENEKEITKNYLPTEKIIGGWGFYSKQVALQDNLYYPLMLSTNLQYFMNGTQRRLTEKPFIFFTRNSNRYRYENAGYSHWKIQTFTEGIDTLIFKQNYFKGWVARVNGHDSPVFKMETSLSGIALTNGDHDICIAYKKDSIKYLLLLQWVSLLLISIYLIRHYLIKYILP